MISDLKKNRSRGPMEDLWDRGASIPGMAVWTSLWIELLVLGALAIVFSGMLLLYWRAGKPMAVPGVALAICVTLIVTSWVPMLLWGDIPLFDSGTYFAGTYNKPVQIALLLPVVVGLLSIEWLTRKLLKLA